MLGKLHKKGGENKISEGSGQTQAVPKIDHAFASSGSGMGHAKKARNIKLPKPSKKQLLIGVAILAVIAGGIFWYRSTHKEQPINPEITVPDPNNRLEYRQYLLTRDDYQASQDDYLIIGNEYVERKDYDNAEANYKKAESLAKDNFDVLYALATVYRLQQNKDESLKYYDKVIAIASDSNNRQHASLALYQSERQAVANGDFELKQVEYPGGMPL